MSPEITTDFSSANPKSAKKSLALATSRTTTVTWSRCMIMRHRARTRRLTMAPAPFSLSYTTDLKINPEDINRNLYSAFKLRQVFSNLLERQAAFPILVEVCLHPLLECLGCCDIN